MLFYKNYPEKIYQLKVNKKNFRMKKVRNIFKDNNKSTRHSRVFMLIYINLLNILTC